VQLPVALPHSVMSWASLNSFDNDGTQEYGNSIRRHFLNDLVIAYVRYSMLMFTSHNNAQTRIDPARVNDRQLGAYRFEQLIKVYEVGEGSFLSQLRRFRNSTVHYNGVYSATNELDYTFGAQTNYSPGHAGENISAEFNTLLWIHDRLLKTVQRGNVRYLSHNPIPH
jgi:hypothetical protein